MKHGQKLPIQIEKKCFFFSIQERDSVFSKCLPCLRINPKKEKYDHYSDVRDKFPQELQDYFFPKYIQLASKMSTFHNKKPSMNNQNRIVDESVIT